MTDDRDWLAHDLQQLGRAARAQRIRLDLSQQHVGDRAGIHRNHIGAIERGEVNPTYETLLGSRTASTSRSPN